MRFREFKGEIYDPGDVGKEIARRVFPGAFIQKSLDFFSSEKGRIEQANRIEEFELAIMEINHVLGGTQKPFDPSLEVLKGVIGSRQLPLFENDLEFPETRELYRAEVASWRDAKRQFPEWANKEFKRSGTAVVGVAIEYYAVMLGYWIKGVHGTLQERNEISRAFVVGLESVLALHYSDGHLLQDVKQWMVEEKGAFSIQVQKIIEN